jgi:hypothetical protein
MRTKLSYLACAGLAALSMAACTTSHGPQIQSVTPQITLNGDGTYTLDLIVGFDDSVNGDLVDAYTFQTSDGQVNDVNVQLPQAYASPFTIAGIILPANEHGQAALGFHLALYGAQTGLGSTFDGTVTVN